MSTLTFSDLRRPQSLGLLALFLLVVIGVGSLIGFMTAPDQWYESLQKPPFNPPNWLFAPVWFTLYVLIAIAGWRTFVADRNSTGMKLWYGQMVLNWLWSPLWFELHQPWLAFVVILAIDAAVLAFIVNQWSRDRLSAWLFVPYAAWVLFASTLNFSIAILN